MLTLFLFTFIRTDQKDHFSWTVLLQFSKRSLWMNRCCEDERSMIRNEVKSSETYDQVGHSTLVMFCTFLFCTFLFLTFVFFSCPGSSKDKKTEREFYIVMSGQLQCFTFITITTNQLKPTRNPVEQSTFLRCYTFVFLDAIVGQGVSEWVIDSFRYF